MNKDYITQHSKSFCKYDEIIVCNFPNINKVCNWIWFGKSNKNSLGEYSIGKWKLKKLKQ